MLRPLGLCQSVRDLVLIASNVFGLMCLDFSQPYRLTVFLKEHRVTYVQVCQA